MPGGRLFASEEVRNRGETPYGKNLSSEFNAACFQLDTHYLRLGKHSRHTQGGCTRAAAEIQQALAPEIGRVKISQKLFAESSFHVLGIVVPRQRIAEPGKGVVEKTRDYFGRKGSLAANKRDEHITVHWYQRDFESAIRKRSNLHGSVYCREDGGLAVNHVRIGRLKCCDVAIHDVITRR